MVTFEDTPKGRVVTTMWISRGRAYQDREYKESKSKKPEGVCLAFEEQLKDQYG